jgi:hypothetical protein
MKIQGACEEFIDALSLRCRRRLRPLQAVAMALLLLGFPAAASAENAKTAPRPSAHVYLVRGVLNIFSLGMDQIAARLQRRGIIATVHNHIFWASLANEAAAEYKSGRVRTIILVGHSSGATALPAIVARLDRLGVPVSLAIGLDSVFHTSLAGRVGRYINFYVADGAGTPVEKTNQFQGALENVDVQAIPGIGHLTIDKNQIIQERVISAIETVVREPPERRTVTKKKQPKIGATKQRSDTAGAAQGAGR